MFRIIIFKRDYLENIFRAAIRGRVQCGCVFAHICAAVARVRTFGHRVCNVCVSGGRRPCIPVPGNVWQTHPNSLYLLCLFLLQLTYAFFKKLYKMSSKTVFCYFAYDEQVPSSGLLEINKERNESVTASLNAAGWPSKGEVRVFWNNTFRKC